MNTNKYIFALMLGSMSLTSCMNDFLDLEPLAAETEATYFKNLEQFQAAADKLHTDVYAWGGNTTYSIRHDYGTDLISISHDAVNGTNSTSTSDTYYKTTYQRLRACNQLLEKAEAYANKDEIAGPVGQALFFRAWHHFFLLQRFGGITLMLKTPDVSTDIVWGPRNSRYEVVKSVLDDLDAAIGKLQKTTVASTSNDGHVTLEAAKALKARVCLYEGTWEKYNGIGSADATNGDGVKSGAGTAMPENYPSVTDFLTMAKNLSDEIISSGTFELFYGVEEAPKSGNPSKYAHTSYFYLFNLEGSDSNPAGVSKADNKEAIFRSVYDHVNRQSGTNLTHTEPARMTRKLIDMYLCTDGLPVHVSPLFQGYKNMNAEFENRDYRLLACHPKALDFVWGYGMYGVGADYSVDITTLSANKYQYCPNLLSTSSVGTRGRKFCTELQTVTNAGQEAPDCMHIRLAEMYLIYAEAVCELGNGTISDDDLDKSLNIVRARGGIAPLNAALIARAKSLGCEMSYLGEIRRERALELYGEGLRIADVCRWGIAEQVFGTEKCGVYVNYEGEDTYLVNMKNPVTGEAVYKASVWEGNIETETITYEDPAYTPTRPGCLISEKKVNRKFAKKNYLQPIPTDEIQLNPQLLQNPQW
ncbi:MAG: RagB/SusD family nutrient uptake outer membrane protein [Prevotella sp.]